MTFDLMTPQIMSPVTFDLVTLKSNQFIGSARYIHDPSLALIHQSVLKIKRSQAILAHIMSPVTFDLVTPKSNKFIGSARYIHDPSLAGIHQSVLEITQSQKRTDGQPENIMPPNITYSSSKILVLNSRYTYFSIFTVHLRKTRDKLNQTHYKQLYEDTLKC